MIHKKIKNPYFVLKPKNIQSISINQSFLKPKSNKTKKISHSKDLPQNRSTSFQTVKNINLSKSKIKTPIHSRINSERNNLNQTIKKKNRSESKSIKKKNKKVFLDDRSDLQPRNRGLSTPKFGQHLIKAQNLTNSRLDLVLELQCIKNEFAQNLNQISLTCLKRINPLQQNLRKCIVLNKTLLQKEWLLIKKNCVSIKGNKQNEVVQRMILEWQRKRKRILQIQRNLQKALEIMDQDKKKNKTIQISVQDNQMKPLQKCQ